ncbi:LicD family protein [Weissella confusa]|uniref:LicD family protein n=1 Tax=Weissella fermenti TaxID=2987699 RepID=A0ABT6D4N7_9LACO|nr:MULTISPECIES: LicD family protein [Weissella]MBJ7688384.1 LicD family protein [Weissella confusa]MCW0927629.1 LicD family protein [Weissella sp. LMG 11983]MDF9300083.1 LicD family protein [Weissella sp. BK2]
MNKRALTIESVQRIQHTMLGQLMAQLAVKNVPVYLLGGTLLGAVREGQQLGWDDDMDLGLMRQDYDRFIDEFVSSDNQVRLMTEFDYDSWVPYARLVYVPSEAESAYYTINHGVFIDIFGLMPLIQQNFQAD